MLQTRVKRHLSPSSPDRLLFLKETKAWESKWKHRRLYHPQVPFVTVGKLFEEMMQICVYGDALFGGSCPRVRGGSGPAGLEQFPQKRVYNTPHRGIITAVHRMV